MRCCSNRAAQNLAQNSAKMSAVTRLWVVEVGTIFGWNRMSGFRTRAGAIRHMRELEQVSYSSTGVEIIKG